MGSARIVYRWGTKTSRNLTPRAKDIQPPVHAGVKPGLSVNDELPPPGQKAQKIDVSLLESTGLRYFPDDPSAGGERGHGVIAPADTSGEVDAVSLREWSDAREYDVAHRFTVAVQNAIIEPDVVRSGS